VTFAVAISAARKVGGLKSVRIATLNAQARDRQSIARAARFFIFGRCLSEHSINFGN